MKTISFIGSHKNAGKTTVLNFVQKRLRAGSNAGNHICLTSIGINGEDIDSFDHRPKPLIPIYKNTLFITSTEHLKKKAGRYTVVQIFSAPDFKKTYVLGKALLDFVMVIEGPNEKKGILAIKKRLYPLLKTGYLLIDGSVDRQFLAHPDISDAIYVAMVVSPEKKNRKKLETLLYALSLPVVSKKQKKLIEANIKENRKTILFTTNNEVVYIGLDIPFLDEGLKQACLKFRKKPCCLYINGALSKSLYVFLSQFDKLTLILNNFTCWQHIGVSQLSGTGFKPEVRLLNAPMVEKIFFKQEKNITNIVLPDNLTAHNLFRDNIDEIGI